MKQNKQAVLDQNTVGLYNFLQADDKTVPLTDPGHVLSTTQADQNMAPSSS